MTDQDLATQMDELYVESGAWLDDYTDPDSDYWNRRLDAYHAQVRQNLVTLGRIDPDEEGDEGEEEGEDPEHWRLWDRER